MNGSILEDIRVACDLEPDDSSFDRQLILDTNTFLFRSAQMGVGKKGFAITGPEEVWTDFVDEDFDEFQSLKTYIALRVKLIFDPPDSVSVLAALERIVDELGWCIYNEADIRAE